MKKILALTLLLAGSVAVFAQSPVYPPVVWGEWGSRTDTRNDAGLLGNAGATSGFFQAENPVNYPAGASGWWHLLDIRHSNINNNFAMQFAGSFYDQNLFFRKTNNSPTSPWARVVTEINGNVGIRTASPVAALQIGYFATSNDNQVLIPGTYNFERAGFGQTSNGNSMLEFVNHTSLQQSYGVRIGANIDKFGSGLYIVGAPAADSYEKLVYSNKPALFVGAASNTVGIGTNNTAGHQLAVAGSMIAERIKVKQVANWPDYVFGQAYQLPSLQSVADFIRDNGHLPEIPSAAEVTKEGLDLTDMNTRLLKKVEELTLYLLQQQQLIEKLQQQHVMIIEKMENISGQKAPNIK